MRNRIRPLVLALSLLACPAIVWAQGPAANPGKIGVINIQAAIANTGEGKKAFGELDKKYAPRRQDLQEQQQSINALQDQLQKQANTLSDEEQRRLSRDLEEKQKLFKRSGDDADSDYRAEGQDVITRIGKKMVPIINEYCQQKGFSLIFDPAALQLPVYYLTKDSDITEEIIKRYDAANPSEGGDAATPAGAPAKRPAAGTKPAAPVPKPVDKPKS